MHPNANIEKKKGGKGDFVVTVDGKLIWDKNSHPDRRFPEHDEILAALPASS